LIFGDGKFRRRGFCRLGFGVLHLTFGGHGDGSL
jgi:hypothetical protein